MSTYVVFPWSDTSWEQDIGQAAAASVLSVAAIARCNEASAVASFPEVGLIDYRLTVLKRLGLPGNAFPSCEMARRPSTLPDSRHTMLAVRSGDDERGNGV